MNRFLSGIGVMLISAAAVAADLPRKSEAPPVADINSTNQTANPVAGDLETLQGRWTLEHQNAFGATIRKELIIQGDHYTITELDPKGNVFFSQHSTIELSHQGSLCTATHTNAETTAGANFGQRPLGSNTYLYRVDGDNLYQVWGILKNDPAQFEVRIWNRAK